MVKYLAVDSFIRIDHRVDGETLLDVFAAGSPVDFRKFRQGLYRFVHIVDQKAGPSVFDHFTAGAQVHRDHRHARGIRLCQNKSESFRDRVQVQQCSRVGKQFVLAWYVDRSDVADLPIIKMRFHLLLEVGLVLNDAGNQERPSALASDFDRQMNAFVRVNPAQKDQVVPAALVGAGTT